MVSIIIPVYNAQNYIQETLESVLSQSFEDWELILVDDVSGDDSGLIIRRFMDEHPQRRIRLFVQERNAGAAAARNRGIDEAEGRYIAFLDADDLWYPDKLEKQIAYMQKHDAAFCFTAYEFGDEKAVPTGKAVRAPKTLDYRQALCRTVIFTSTVVIDTQKIGKVHMPEIASEDTATWWMILKEGTTALGLNQPLVIYRRPAVSLSSNKAVAVQRIWGLYRKVAQLSTGAAVWNLLRWAWKTTVRRAVDDAVMSHVEAIKRFTVLQLSLIGVLLQTALYAFIWFRKLYPVLRSPRIARQGFVLGNGIKLFFRGHILILLIYLLMLVFLLKTSGGWKTGYLRPWNVFSCEVTAVLITNVLTYFQLSLMKNWLFPVVPFLVLTITQLVLAAVWAFLSDCIYRRVFPAQEALVVNFPASGMVSAYAGTFGEVAGALPDRQDNLKHVLEQLETRSDRFNVMKVMDAGKADLEEIKKETLRWYGCVILCGEDTAGRREVMEYCYRHIIRVYLLPAYSDMLVQGMDHTALIDTPMFALKEYSIRWEVRIVKRILGFLLCLLPALVSLPGILLKRTDTCRCFGKRKKPFTRYGRGFVNVLLGQMALVGPTARSAEEGEAEDGLKRRESYCYRIKPGIIGYAQLHSVEDTSREDLLKMDLYYILHHSLLGDFKLILQAITMRKK